LDHIVHGFHLLFEIVSGDLIVFDDTTDNKFEDSEGNGFLLAVLFPGASVHLAFLEDSLEEIIEVGLRLKGLDLEHDDGLGNSLFLGVGLVDGGLLCFAEGVE